MTVEYIYIYKFSCTQRVMTTTLEELHELRSYKKGNFYVHVIAFRINTVDKKANLLVSDYTGNSEIVDEWTRALQHNIDDIITREEIINVRTSVECLESIFLAHESKFRVRVSNVTFNENNWVDVRGSFCIAHLLIGFHRNMSLFSGHINQIFPVDSGNLAYLDLLSRIASRYSNEMLRQNPISALRILENVLSGETIEDLKKLVSQSQSWELSSLEGGQVKLETSVDDNEKPSQIQSMLEPASQYYHQQPPQSQPDAQIPIQESEMLTQLLRQSQDTFLDDDSLPLPTRDLSQGEWYSLSQLNRLEKVPSMKNRIFKTKAMVVGSNPSDLSFLCCKTYYNKQGKLALGDPSLTNLELFLADSESNILSAENSLSVIIKTQDLLDFFDIDMKEKLYTRLRDFDHQFKQRNRKFVDLELVAEGKWTARNLKFAFLL